MLYAGSNLDRAKEIFAAAVKHRPRIRLNSAADAAVASVIPVDGSLREQKWRADLFFDLYRLVTHAIALFSR
jgi:hypothetical protein